MLSVPSRRAAYGVLAVLTLVWGFNWIAMKAALLHANPLAFNVDRTWLAIAALVVVLVARRGRIWPQSWLAVIVTGFFQTTINFGSTIMAVAGGGAGRASVLVFTMPFWTLLIAWPVLHERVRPLQLVAIALAVAGLVLTVAPWAWEGDLAPKAWAVLSGFGWAAGTVAVKYFQRDEEFDMLTLITWQMIVGIAPLTVLAWVHGAPSVPWTLTQTMLLVFVGVIATAGGFLAWMEVLRWLAAGTASLNMLVIPVIALLSSMVVFGEKLAANEWAGIALIGCGLAVITAIGIAGGRRARMLPAEPTPLEGG
jgi:drug/metabolite transporter (DMT)-like permease